MNRRISLLVARAYSHYSDQGFQGLAWNSVLFTTKKLIQRQSLSRTQLQNIAAEGDRIWYLDQEKTIKISSPTHVVLQEAFKPYPKEYNLKRSFVCEIENGHLIGPNAVGMSENNQLIAEITDVISFAHLGSPSKILKRLIGPASKSTEDYWDTRVFPLVSPDPSFYHWVMEYLPRLRLLEHYEEQTRYEPIILIESDPPEYVQDTLNLAGYGSDRYMKWPGGEKQVKKLIIPSKRPHAFDYQYPSRSNYQASRSDYHWLRNRMQSNSIQNRSTMEKSSKIYISRQMASPKRGRKVVNYQQFINELYDRGFKPYILEELSFQEQVNLFTDADIILGPHGAGFANMIFSNDPLIIEMFPKDVLRPHFYFLANVLGYKYEGIVTESYKGDLVVDIESFRNQMDEITV